MIKKMMLLAVAAAAVVAFAVPATASATALVHDALGAEVKAVSAVSTTTVSTTKLGNLDCNTVVLSVNLAENTTTTAQGAGTGEAYGTKPAGHVPGSHCEGPGKTAVTVNGVTVDKLHLGANGTGHAEFTFKVSSLPQCTIDGTANLTYNKSTLTLVEGKLTGTPVGNPCSLLDGTIVGSFTLGGGVTVGA